jgi:rare lipoprotein A (peptidoglycan hydrolase)
MVTDRGPYVGTRILDMSHAGAVAVGNSGLATVRIEILAPAG